MCVHWRPIATAPVGVRVIVTKPGRRPVFATLDAEGDWTDDDGCGLFPNHWTPAPTFPDTDDTPHVQGVQSVQSTTATALLIEIEHQADPGRNYTDPKTGETFISLPLSVLTDIDAVLRG